MSTMYTPAALAKGIKGMLLRAMLNEKSNFLGHIAMLEPSDSDKEDYVWLGEAPRMRELDDDDEVIYDGISDTTYSLTNKLWKSGLTIKRKHLDDGKINAIQKRITQLARVGKQHINRLVVDALINGTTTACYDGANFFSNTHTARGQQTAAQDNLLAGNGSSVANLQVDVMAAIQQLMGFLAENNEPFDEVVQRVAVVYPVGLQGAMHDAIRGQLISNTSNERFGDVVIDLVPTARLTADANDYYVMNVGQASDLPIVIQQRDALEVLSLTTGDDAFDREEYKYQVRWRGVSGYAHWQRAIKVVNA